MECFLSNYKFIELFIYFLVFINEVGNDVAAKAVEVAANYIKKTPSLGFTVEIVSVEGNRTDSKGLLEQSKWYSFNLFLWAIKNNNKNTIAAKIL